MWHDVKNRTQASKRHDRKTRTVTDDISTEGFRTFASQEHVFSEILPQKLRKHFVGLQVDVETKDGAMVNEVHQFRFVLLTLTGDAHQVDAAYDEAKVFLRTAQQDRTRFVCTTWKPSSDDQAKVSLREMIARVPRCMQTTGYCVNYSEAKSCFYFVTLLLSFELQHTSAKQVEARMISEIGDFLTLPGSQTFRINATGPPASARNNPPATGAVRTASQSNLDQTFVARVKAAQFMPFAEARRELQKIAEQFQPPQTTADGILKWLSMCYEIEKQFILLEYSANETRGLSVRLAPDFENLFELNTDPGTGQRPFTQRYPKINCDDTLLVQLSDSDRKTAELKIYIVKDYGIIAHLAKDEAGILGEAASMKRFVDVTFDSRTAVAGKTFLQKACGFTQSFDRLRGVGGIATKTADYDAVKREFKKRRILSAPNADETQPVVASPPPSRGGAGRGRGNESSLRFERGGYSGQVRSVGSRPNGSGREGVEAPTCDDLIFDNLTEDQSLAITAIVNKLARRIKVEGPAGTGKSEVLVRSILDLLKSGGSSKLLVVAPTNSAADVLARRLADACSNVDLQPFLDSILRFYGFGFHPLNCDPVLYMLSNRPQDSDGEPRPKHQITYDDRFDKSYMENMPLDRHRVIVLTPNLVRFIPLEWAANVSHLIIDEAGNTSLAESLISVECIPPNATIVLAGDQHQLQPRVSFPPLKQWLQLSPFTYFDGPDVLNFELRDSFRASTGLVELQSFLFYDGKLRSGQSASADRSYFPTWTGHRNRPAPIRIVHCDSPEESTTRPTTDKSEANNAGIDALHVINVQEINIVDHIVRSLLQEFKELNAEDIAVLCDYPEQQRRVRQRLQMVGAKRVSVRSVEESQGSEKDVVIALFCRSQYDPKDPYAMDLNKLCTAITRPRRLGIVVANVPVWLERDRDRHHKRNSNGKFTDLVQKCRDELNSVDLYDAKTATYKVAPLIKVSSRIEVKEFVSKTRADLAEQRKMVPLSEVLENKSEYFVGVVESRRGGVIQVRNRFACPVNVRIDEHVSSGLRGYSVFPGDLVAVAINPDRTRWIPDAWLPVEQHDITALPLTSRPKPASQHFLLDDFAGCYSVTEFGLTPVGHIVCIIGETTRWPPAITGSIQGPAFVPSTDFEGYPTLPLFRGSLAGKKHQQRDDSDAGCRTTAFVAHIPDESGVSRRHYMVDGAPTPVPVIPSGPLSAAELTQIRQGVPIAAPEEFFAVTSGRGLYQPLCRINAAQLTSHAAAGFASVTITVLAPGTGLSLTQGEVLDAAHNRASWSNDALNAIRNHEEYPLFTDLADPFALPTPTDGGSLLMVGVEMVITYFEGGFMVNVPPKDYVGPTITGIPKIVMYQRPAVRYTAPPDNVKNNLLRILSRPNIPDLVLQSRWNRHLQHLANSAAAFALLQQPGGALLLRQTRMPVARGSEYDTPTYDPPEWYVPSSFNASSQQWQLHGYHSPSGNVMYTSFFQPHHSYGDIIVQRLMAMAHGQHYKDRSRLLDHLRQQALRLNSVGIQPDLRSS